MCRHCLLLLMSAFRTSNCRFKDHRCFHFLPPSQYTNSPLRTKGNPFHAKNPIRVKSLTTHSFNTSKARLYAGIPDAHLKHNQVIENER